MAGTGSEMARVKLALVKDVNHVSMDVRGLARTCDTYTVSPRIVDTSREIVGHSYLGQRGRRVIDLCPINIRSLSF